MIKTGKLLKYDLLRNDYLMIHSKITVSDTTLHLFHVSIGGIFLFGLHFLELL